MAEFSSLRRRFSSSRLETRCLWDLTTLSISAISDLCRSSRSRICLSVRFL